MARPLSGARLRATALTLPLLAFVALTFIAPLGSMLVRSFYEPHVADALPRTLAALRAWDGSSVPSENTFRILGTELRLLDQQRKLGGVATRVNRLEGGMRSAIMDTARALRSAEPDSWREAITTADPAWGEAAAWRAMRRAGERYTIRHYLNALDLDRDPSGNIVAQSPERRIYLPLLLRTLGVSLAITLICLILGYPVAYLIANASPARSNLLLLLVLVPFWTSLLVRTTSWIVLLQNQGVVNDVLVAAGVIGEDGRVFILSIGYYITPALVGGRTGQLISNMISYHMQESLNWGLAAALGVILLVTVMSLYLVYNRLVGIERMRLS